jgi:hypothetical protein
MPMNHLIAAPSVLLARHTQARTTTGSESCQDCHLGVVEIRQANIFVAFTICASAPNKLAQ